MVKRRNMILGMGALAMGSGAVLSQAEITGESTTPGADFQVLADALRIQARSDSDDDVFFETDPGATSDFARNELPRLEVSETDTNSALSLSLGGGTGVDNTFGSDADEEPLEIINDTSTEYDVRISYADPDDIAAGGNGWGYGGDVSDQEAANNDPETSNQLSYERVNGIFSFDTSGAEDTNETQISPTSTAVEGSSVTLGPSEIAAVQVTINTTNNLDGQSDAEAINSAAGTGETPWGEGTNWLDLLNEVHVVAEETS